MIFKVIKKKWQQIPILGKVVVYFVFGLLTLAFLFPPEPQPVDFEEVDFFSLQSDQLYFKNVRSYYYRQKEDQEAGFVLYRHKGFDHQEFSEPLRIMLVQNWRIDEVYVFFETEEIDIEHAIIIEQNGEFQKLNLRKINNEGHFKVAAKCYNALIKGAKFYYESELLKERIPLFQNQRKERAVRSTFEDYFKLVGKI